MKITIADQDGVDAFPEQVAWLLDLLGYPEAFVTDESWISDFIDTTMGGSEYMAAKEKIWAKIEERWKVDVRPEVSILGICRAIAAQNRTAQ